MTPNDKLPPASRPDCPREYHDDYIGRPARNRRAALWLLAAGVLMVAFGAVWALAA